FTDVGEKTVTWTGSVPPRGSGWVHAQRFWLEPYGVPTRYREVVLTRSKHVTFRGALTMKFCLFVLLVAMRPVVNAQAPEVIRTNTELVQTAVTVLDKKGNFVEGLKREQFELVVDGKSRPVAFFERIAAGSARERELATLADPTSNTTTAPTVAPSRV